MRVLGLLAIVLVATLAVSASAKKHSRKHRVTTHKSDGKTDDDVTEEIENVPTQVEALPGTPAPKWSYNGENGPDMWGHLDTRFRVCRTGAEQSPIDLVSSEVGLNALLEIPNFTDYMTLDPETAHVEQESYTETEPERGAIINTGHYLLLHWGAESALTIGGSKYSLDSLAFHSPSEHTVDGEHMDMEMEIMHTSDSGEKLIVSVFFVAKDGGENAFLSALKFGELPQEVGASKVVDSVSLADSLPNDKSFYKYTGSMTHPPCAEGVEWFVLQKPLFMCKEQLENIRSVFDGNFRPTQPIGERAVNVNKALFISTHEVSHDEPDGDKTHIVMHPNGGTVTTRTDVGSDDSNSCDGCSFKFRAKRSVSKKLSKLSQGK